MFKKTKLKKELVEHVTRIKELITKTNGIKEESMDKEAYLDLMCYYGSQVGVEVMQCIIIRNELESIK